jgi:rubrerythrin
MIMAVVTVADVLKHAEEFEELLADYYATLSQRTTREGVRLLTDYMSRHRQRLAEALDRFPPEQASRIRGTHLRYEPQAADCRCFEGIEVPPDASAAQVLDAAVNFDECLINLYRQVLQQPVDEEIRELFESLVRAEQRDEIELKKIKAMDYF